MLGELVCKMLGHKVNRKRVWDDGISFRGRCNRCHAPMIRDIDAWRTFDPEIDLDPNRKPHPRFDTAKNRSQASA